MGETVKFEKLGAIAEIVSSVAILATLGYLAVQTQQTNSALLANSRQTTMLADITLIAAIIANPEAAENALKEAAELTEAERQQVGMAIAGLLRSREFTWLQYKSGILDQQTLDSYMGTFIRWIEGSEVSEQWWDQFSQEVDPEFVAYVEALRARD